MRKWDILIVRFLPFILFVIFGMNVLFACTDRDPFLSYELHGNSALYATSLFLISLANNRYHCVWNRAMYIFLIFVPVLNYIDSLFYIIPSDKAYILTINISYILTAIITAYLAIRHFVQGVKRKMKHGR